MSASTRPPAELAAAVGLAVGTTWRPRPSGAVYRRLLSLERRHGRDALERALALAGAEHLARRGRRPEVAWLLELARRLLEDDGQARHPELTAQVGEP